MAVNGGGQPKGNQGIQRNEIHQLTMSSSGHESMLIFTGFWVGIPLPLPSVIDGRWIQTSTKEANDVHREPGLVFG